MRQVCRGVIDAIFHLTSARPVVDRYLIVLVHIAHHRCVQDPHQHALVLLGDDRAVVPDGSGADFHRLRNRRVLDVSYLRHTPDASRAIDLNDGAQDFHLRRTVQGEIPIRFLDVICAITVKVKLATACVNLNATPLAAAVLHVEAVAVAVSNDRCHHASHIHIVANER
jgi:hypothetical protein